MKGRKPPQRDETGANLQWPPTKEDLERLYVEQRLSAMKISKVYGLKYPNPKSGATMILFYLKKEGDCEKGPGRAHSEGDRRWWTAGSSDTRQENR